MSSFALRRTQRARELTPGVFVGDVTELSREALVTFLELAERGEAVDRAQLSSWLFGPYLDALSIGRHRRDDAAPSLVVEDVASEEEVVGVVARAYQGICRVLVAFHANPDPSVAARLVARGVVEPVSDERGNMGYAPLDDPGMTLTLRVLAITAAEMLTRPGRLRGDLVVNGDAVHIGERPIVSGVAMRSRQTVPWTPPRGDRESSPGWPARAPTLAELAAAADGVTPDDDAS